MADELTPSNAGASAVPQRRFQRVRNQRTGEIIELTPENEAKIAAARAGGDATKEQTVGALTTGAGLASSFLAPAAGASLGVKGLQAVAPKALTLGQKVIGATAGTGAGAELDRQLFEGRSSTGGEILFDAATGAVPEFAVAGAKRLLFTPSGKQLALEALQRATGRRTIVGTDEAARFTENPRTAALGDPSSPSFGRADPRAEQTLSGALIKEEAPRTFAREKAKRNELFQRRDRLMRHEPPRVLPNALTDQVRGALDFLENNGTDLSSRGSVADAKDILGRLLKRADETVETLTDDAGQALTDVRGSPLTRTIQPESISFEELSKVQRDLNDVLPGFMERHGAREPGVVALNNVDAMLRRELDDMVRVAGRGPQEAHEAAKQYHREVWVPTRETVKELFDDKIGPTQVINLIKSDPDKLRVWMRALPERHRILVRQGYLHEMMGKYVDPDTGVFNIDAFAREWDGLGTPTQTALLGGGPHARDINGAITNIRRHHRADPAVQRRAAQFATSLALWRAWNAAQDGDVVGLATWVGAGGILWMLPDIMADPKVAKLWNQGLRPTASKAALGRLTTHMAGQGVFRQLLTEGRNQSVQQGQGSTINPRPVP